MSIQYRALSLAIMTITLAACNSGSDDSQSSSTPPISEPINIVYVAEELYPNNFRQHLDSNMQFFQDGVGVSATAKVPFDNVNFDEHGGLIEKNTGRLNVTALGLYLNVLTEMEKAGSREAKQRLFYLIHTMEKMPKWKGNFYWMYRIEADGRIEKLPKAVSSAVDAANLITSMAAVAGAYWEHSEPDLRSLARRFDTLIKDSAAAWSFLYDNQEGLLRGGYRDELPDGSGSGVTSYFIDRKTNESRLAPIWAHLLTQQMEKPIPETVFNNMRLYYADYKASNGSVLQPMLTWKGAYFQAMLPSIWFDEPVLSGNSQLFEHATQTQIDYTRQYKIPFLSSSATISGGYSEYGIDAMSEHFHRNEIHSSQEGVGTPHASALYALLDKQHAIELMLEIEDSHPQVVSDYGWYDALNIEGKVQRRLISLDQGMFVGSFLAEKLREDVKNYVEKSLGIDAWLAIESMYGDFKADGICDESGCRDL
ncbi:glucoamylase family protein [Photobacterium lutimaris]|uniref:Uncharacterized protein n=1 Tax=Photobacterium lutimaris TaxID=388278 RepID=A0A2T3IYV9_9GAMM|nr:glucoamylase family protein [Photobacterium lutimaris]PSU33851.1 hypothetical protein C9I99_10790 [Photobacterium lutimaris]TDR76176.1 putative glucoamylase [Photobacterium lutimaris]